eukprot:13204081-Ditylum_brightwellii.AAC.2
MIQALMAPSLVKVGAFTSLFHVGPMIGTKVSYITKKLLNPETNKFQLSSKKKGQGGVGPPGHEQGTYRQEWQPAT